MLYSPVLPTASLFVLMVLGIGSLMDYQCPSAKQFINIVEASPIQDSIRTTEYVVNITRSSLRNAHPFDIVKSSNALITHKLGRS